MLKIIISIGLGSFLGGISRFLLSRAVQSTFITHIPIGTLIVNILGCFLIGILYSLFEVGIISNNHTRMFLTVGFCGGFTTFSTFSHENLMLLQDGNFFLFSIYTFLSLFLGLLATLIGHYLTKIIIT